MKKYSLVVSLLCYSAFGFAQELLNPEEAVKIALENNFGIQISKNLESQSQNNASILNSGYLPTLSTSAAANLSKDSQEATFQDGRSQAVDGAETKRYNASVNLNYTLFDGLGRMYTYKALKEQYALSSLAVRQSIEQTLLQLYAAYFDVAQLDERVRIFEKTLANSKMRLKRAQKRFEFGSTSRLEVLNAKVDANTDSINLLQQIQSLSNAKRNLNLILARDLEEDFSSNPNVRFVSDSVLSVHRFTYASNNVRLLQAERNQEISVLQLKAQKSNLLPQLNLTGAYGYSEGVFPATNFLASSNSRGVSAGLSLNWNIFSGGRQQVAIRNAKLAKESQELQELQIQQEVERDLRNAEGNYRNARMTYELQIDNVITAEDNYNRSQKRFELGQITSIELRQAQLNTLATELSRIQAKFTAKLAELEYLQHCGALLNVAF
ncbi:MAG: transporter [Flavobacteriaceae bacterium]|nr:transporter [Flavobacteriaceae bacterium]